VKTMKSGGWAGRYGRHGVLQAYDQDVRVFAGAAKPNCVSERTTHEVESAGMRQACPARERPAVEVDAAMPASFRNLDFGGA